MKIFMLSFAVLLFVQSVTCQAVAPTKCEDVLPLNVCTSLRSIAVKFHEKAGIVNQAIIEAYKKHKTHAKEILAFTKEFLVQHAVNFKCEDFLTEESCAKVTDLAKKLHVSAKQTGVAIREAIVNGASKASDIYKKAALYMAEFMSNLTCEGVLGAEQCAALKKFTALIHVKATEINVAVRVAISEGALNAKEKFNLAMDFLKTEVTCDKILGAPACDNLRKAASELKEKAGSVHAAVLEALNKHLTKTSDILASIKESLVARAKNFNCEDILSAKQCDAITSIGQKFHLKSTEILTAVKEAVVNGHAQITEIYNRAIGFLLNDVKNLKCEDLATVEVCNKIRENAKKFHANAKDVATAVKEAIVEGATNAKDYIKKATEFLKAKVSCESVMSVERCDKIRQWADKLHVSLSKVDDFLRIAIANGATSVTKLYAAAIKWITERWIDAFGDEPLKMKRGVMEKVDEVREALRKKLRLLAGQLLDTLKVADLKVREFVLNAIAAGKVKLTTLKEQVKELIEKSTQGVDAADDAAVAEKRKTFRETLVETLKKVHGKFKVYIEKLLKLSSQKLEEMKVSIKNYLKLEDDQYQSDELDADFELVNDYLREVTEESFSNIVADAIDFADQ